MDVKEFFEKQGLDLKKGLFLVYGKAATGKTTFLMEMCKVAEGKAFVIDSENGFSIERFEQIVGKKTEIESLIVSRPESFEGQAEIISKIVDGEKLFGFIGMDTIGKHYRAAVKKDSKNINNEIARQMRVLKEISRNKPVIVCNQVYQNFKTNDVEPLGGNFVKKWCDIVIKLDEVNGTRIIEIIKPKEIKGNFELCDKGFTFSSL
jgi:RecA/RadA recombinase